MSEQQRKSSLDSISCSSKKKSGLKGFFKSITNWGSKSSAKQDMYTNSAPEVALRRVHTAGVLKPDRRPHWGLSDDTYDMNHRSRGKVYIFNHKSFKKNETRTGTEKDEENLLKSLPKLGFLPENIKSYNDLTLSKLDDALEEISQDDHSQSDLLIVFVLSHGDRDGKVYSYDSEYSVEKIWKYFTGEKCETLRGKPKIFFIIACRGDKTDDGSKINYRVDMRKPSITETDAIMCQPTITYTIPNWADFLIVYSTMTGHLSYRNPMDGTWYIQSLCQELRNAEEKNLDFMRFLTAVNRRVAFTYQTFNLDPSLNNKKQCPIVTSTLTKNLIFNLNQTSTSTSNTKTETKNKLGRPKSFNR